MVSEDSGPYIDSLQRNDSFNNAVACVRRTQGCCPSYADEAHERAFAVYVNCDVGIQPFLLIVRTGRIVTAHAHTLVWHMNE